MGFFPLLFVSVLKETSTFVLHVNSSCDVYVICGLRTTTVCDVALMYCKERYMEIVPFAMKPHGIRNIQTQLPPIIYMCICTFNLLFTEWENSLADCLYPNITCPFQNRPGLPPPFLHTASDQKLDTGKAWE